MQTGPSSPFPHLVQIDEFTVSELVDHVIDTVRGNLFEGGLLVIAVLFIFLGNLRAGLIVAVALVVFGFLIVAGIGLLGAPEAAWSILLQACILPGAMGVALLRNHGMEEDLT